MTRTLLFGLSLTLALGLACSDDGATGPNPSDPIATVAVSPDQPSVVMGETVQLQATPKTAAGKPVTNLPVSWKSNRTDIATVSTTGLVTGQGPGTAEITAGAGGKQGKATVVVQTSPNGPVTTVELDVTVLALEEGAVQQITATAKDARGQPVAGRVVQWTSTASDVAGVEHDGTVTAIRTGTTSINAKVDGVTGSAAVTVTATYGYDVIYEQSSGAGQAPELFRLDLREPGGVPSRMFPAGRVAMQAAVSPDGTRIAFVVLAASNGSHIYVADGNGDNAVKLTSMEGFHDQPAWSHDGRIAYRHWSMNGGTDIWVMNDDGSDAVNVTQDQTGAAQHEPAWSPGQPGRIAYSKVENGLAHIWTMLPDGSDKRPITTGEVYDYEPSWSPDGQHIVFGRTGSLVPGSDLFVVAAAGSGLRKLIALPLGQFGPTFSPDGRLVAFTSAHDGDHHVYTVWTDGTKLARRTSGKLGHANPTWIMR